MQLFADIQEFLNNSAEDKKSSESHKSELKSLENDFLSLLATKDNDATMDTVTDIVEYRDDHGVSPLHHACALGSLPIVKKLISLGHPWNVVDSDYVSAAQYASSAGFMDVYDFLVDEGVRTEFILGTLAKYNKNHDSNDVENEDDKDDDGVTKDNSNDNNTGSQNPQVPSNQEYLNSKLSYEGDVLVDEAKNAVMMGWETPLMKLHAERLCSLKTNTGNSDQEFSILNIGFGMGIIDTLIQEIGKPTRHVIIEAHPDVYAKMVKDGWTTRPGVQVLFGRWQDVIHEAGCFDAVFYDTFGEFYDDQREFHEHLPNLLIDENSIYSFFNGLAGTNPFFHDVTNRLAELDLQDIGLSTEYERITVEELGNETWKNLARPYYNLPYYDLPTCKLNF